MSRKSRTDWFGRLGRIVAVRPRLAIAAAIGISVFAVAASLSPEKRWPTWALVAWDLGVGFYLLAITRYFATTDAAAIRSHAAQQDVGQFAVLGFAAAASLASLSAIYAQAGLTGRGDIAAGLEIALVIVTIVFSWLFIHVIFAIHYAHEFYGPESEEPGGLAFPGGLNEPDYWDFLYFSLVIGMTSQVADVGVTDRRIRRTVTAHGVVAFFFNVALLALGVNVGAGALQ